MLNYRVIIALITWIAGMKGFGPKTIKHLKNGLKQAKLTRQAINFAQEIEGLFRLCLRSARVDAVATTLKTVQTAGGITGMAGDRIMEMVESVASLSRTIRGKLLEASVLIPLRYKMGPLGYSLTTQEENVETDRGGHPDIILHGPNGHSYILELKTVATTAYKVPLFEHTEYPFYLILLGENKVDLSANQIAIMHRFGCQPVVICNACADKEGVMTFDEMIAEIRKDEGPVKTDSAQMSMTA